MSLKYFLNRDVGITVQIIDDPPSSTFVSLNLKDNLSNIRNKLKQEIEMNDTLSFAKKAQTSTKSHVFAEIKSKDEKVKILNDIVVTINNDIILYLIKNSKPDWKFLNNKRKLEYGCIIT